MTNADVAAFINEIKSSHGREIDADEASTILGAKDILAADPNNTHAQLVLKHFASFLITGIEQSDFHRFMLPEDCMYTVEEKSQHEASRTAYLESQEAA